MVFFDGGVKKFWLHREMVSWILQCISTVSFSVLVNGNVEGFFRPGRGLRQGGPLSPFLFILCSEVLSRLIAKDLEDGYLHGINIKNGSPNISHLLFADDLLIFGRANVTEVDNVLECIQKYGRWPVNV